MHFDLVAPCGNCPFRTDITFYLKGERVEEIVEAITDGDQTFACHKTTKHDDEDGHVIRSRDEQHCAGALILLEKNGYQNQMMRIAGRIGLYDPSKLTMDAPVFETPDDMINHFYDLDG